MVKPRTTTLVYFTVLCILAMSAWVLHTNQDPHCQSVTTCLDGGVR